MPIQVDPPRRATSKVIPATVAAVLLILAWAIATRPRTVIAVVVILALGAGLWLGQGWDIQAYLVWLH